MDTKLDLRLEALEDVIEKTLHVQEETDMEIYNPFIMGSRSLGNNSARWMAYFESVDALPKSVQELLQSETTMQLLFGLGHRLRLSAEQSAILSCIIKDVLIGNLFGGDMADEIGRQLQIPPGTAKQIRDEVVENLFRPAIEDIKKVQRQKFSTKFGSAPAAQIPPAAPVPVPHPAQPNLINLKNPSQS